MELAIDDPNLRAKEYADKASGYKSIQGAPLAQREPGVGEQMAGMAKQRAMKGALDEGQKGMMSALTPASAGATNAAALAANPATMGMGGAEVALAGQSLAPAVAGSGMATVGAAMPYVGAAMLADKALGLGIMDSFFSEGGEVGPLSPQYNYRGGMAGGRGGGYGGDGGLMERNIVNPIKNIYNKYFPYEGEDLSYNSDLGNAQNNYDSGGRYNSPYVKAAEARAKEMGIEIDPRAYDTPEERYKSQGGPISYKAEGGNTMSEEQARALMNNQPEPTPMPMMRPDPRELMAEIKQEMAMPQPRSRPASINPYDAAMNYEGYDPILPAPTDLPQYRAGGGPLGMGVLGMYHDMMKKNMG